MLNEKVPTCPQVPAPALVLGQQGVGAVLQQVDAVLVGDSPEPVGLRGEAPQVGDPDGLGATGDALFHRVGVHEKVVGPDVGPDRHDVVVQAGDAVELHQGVADHLVAGADGTGDGLHQQHGRAAGKGRHGPTTR